MSRTLIPLTLLAIGLAAAPASAQERGYWIANRQSSDIMEVAPWGGVVRRIDLATNLRGAHTAPDGKVWVVRFIQSTFDIVDPATGTVTNVASTLGSPYDIAFDAQGDAWVSGGTGVQHFDANGTLVQAYPLTESAPLGITIDAAGNKWIAHRVPAGSVSRIDPNGVVTNHPVGVTQPVRVVADFRGLTMPSHIWVTGDGGGQLAELDENGNEIQNYPMPNTQIGSVGPIADRDGDIWVGSFGSGELFKIDRDTGALLLTVAMPAPVLGLAVDTQGRILATLRVSFSGLGPACEVRRVDPLTGTVEAVTELDIGGSVGIGTQDAASTPFHHALVVDPLGDTDGDGEPNFTEIQNGTSPIDAGSNSTFSVATVGVSRPGGSVDVVVQASQLWILGFSPSLLAAGMPVPYANGLLQIDDSQLVTTAQGTTGATITLAIPNDPALVGYEMFCQGLTSTGGMRQLRNVSGIRIW